MAAGMLEAEMRIPLPNRRATRRLGAAIGGLARAGDMLFLEGELGAGKTFLVRALARRLGIPSAIPIQSPTFALVHEHELRSGRLVHADLYRLGNASELGELGVEEWDDAIVCLEWAERFRDELEPNAGSLSVRLSGAPREAHLFARGPRGVAWLGDLQAALATPSSAR